MRLALTQTDPHFGKTRQNVSDAVALMATAAADLYVLPELFNTGYNFLSREEVADLSEDDTGFTMQTMLGFAKRNSCYIAYGYAEKAPGENNEVTYYNSSALVGPEGLVGRYRKVHLFYREKLFFAPGNLGFPVFDLPFGKVGMMICFDWMYPESARSLALNGAQLIAHPSNLVLPYCPDGMITRCLENRVFAATADRVGQEFRDGIDLTYIGTSQLVSNKGRILARCSDDKPEIVVVEIDLAQALNKNLNEYNNLLNDRKSEQYQW